MPPDDSGASGGGSRRKALKEVSLTDPQGMSRKEAHRPILCLRCKPSHRQKAGIIVDAEGTHANRAAKIAITQAMVDRIKRRFDLRPRRLAGDSV